MGVVEFFKLILEYDGTNYHGWQFQPNLVTIQGIVEDSLFQITKEKIRVKAAGRTDAGVHAKGQVVNFATALHIGPDSLLKALNSLLPEDIAVKEVSLVSASFDARHSAKAKLYYYYIYYSSIPSPFWSRYSMHIPYQLNFESMSKAAGYLLGEHDFSAFRASTCSSRSTIRTMEFIRIEPMGKLICVSMKANGFLHHMARNVVGTLLEVGRKKIPPEHLLSILLEGKREKAGPTAPPQGLFLQKVFF